MANPLWQSGQSGNPNGRPKGSPNKVTDKLRQTITQIVEDKLDTFEDLWADLNPKDQAKLLEALIKYAVPALSSVQIEGNIDHTQKIIKVIYEDKPQAQEQIDLN